MAWLILLVGIVATPPVDPTAEGVQVRVPLDDQGEFLLSDLVAQVAARVGLEVEPPHGTIRLPTRGLPGALTRQLLGRGLGEAMGQMILERELILELPADWLEPARLPTLRANLEGLSAGAAREAKVREASYGVRYRKSYRPNDPSRPTICLIHGLNSDYSVFRHMIAPLEAAGFGLVFYDFPYNRDLDETTAAFRRDWAAFRQAKGETRPWAVVTHSMGGLIVRGYVEEDGYAGDVSEILMIAPPNEGSALAGAQTVLQLVEGLQAVNGQQARALSMVSDGLGAAADDMTPGSTYLRELNRRPRRAGVGYHILAGDKGFLDRAGRAKVEARLGLVHAARGPLGGLVRWAAGDIRARLDALTDGLGDGCVALSSTRLDGVADHQTIHADHLELIRAPLMFPDPGPVASLPFILERLGTPANGPGR